MARHFPNLHRKRLYEEVADAIQQTILLGNYKIWDKLPSEAELGRQFQVSRLVIREAIRYLELTGLIEVRQGATGGPFVSELNPKIIYQNLRELLVFGKISVRQLYEVRAHVEPEVARLATLRITKKELKELEQLVLFTELEKPGIEYIRNNVMFHRLLGKFSHNLFYTIIIDSIMDLTEQFILTIKPVKQVIHNPFAHRRIYQALSNRKPDEAAKITYTHTKDVAKEMMRLERIYLKMIGIRKKPKFIEAYGATPSSILIEKGEKKDLNQRNER